jgi:hypothetical protein
VSEWFIKFSWKTQKNKQFILFLMGLGIIHFSYNTVFFMHQQQQPQKTPTSTTTLHRFVHFSSLSNNSSHPPTWQKSPSLSSSFTFMATHFNLSSPSSLSIQQHDLLIVGPGVLGRLVANQWRQVTILSIHVHLIFLKAWNFMLMLCFH